jgi:predicted dehydrogenase
MTNDAAVRVGIASFAHGHAYSYAAALAEQPQASFAGIWDDQPERGRAAAERYGVPFLAQLNDLLAASDTIIVAAENARHRDLVLAAAAAGVHVLCEKPLATSAADARAMVAACADAGVLLGTAFPVRYSPAIRRLRAAVAAGALGETQMVRATNRGTYPGGWFSDPALSGGGALMDHIVHVADLLRWIWGSEFTQVFAEAATRYHDLTVDDCGLVLIHMQNGMVISLDPSWSRPNKAFPTWGDVTLEITSSAGISSVDVFAQNVELYSNQRVRAQLAPWGDNLDRLMIADWLRAVRSGGPAPISGEDGLRVVELVEAAYRSAGSHLPERVGALP